MNIHNVTIINIKACDISLLEGIYKSQYSINEKKNKLVYQK